MIWKLFELYFAKRFVCTFTLNRKYSEILNIFYDVEYSDLRELNLKNFKFHNFLIFKNHRI